METEGASRRVRRLPSWLLAQASLAAAKAVAEVFERRSIHRSQYASLAAIEEFGPISQRALSARTGLDPGDVVRWVDGLSADRLVERMQDPDDRRRNLLTITERGRRTLAELDADVAAAQSRVTKTLEPDESAELVRLLQKLLG